MLPIFGCPAGTWISTVIQCKIQTQTRKVAHIKTIQFAFFNSISGTEPIYYVPSEPHSHPCSGECNNRPNQINLDSSGSSTSSSYVHRHRHNHSHHHHHHHQNVNVWSGEEGSSSRGNYEWYRPRRLRPPEVGDVIGGASNVAVEHQPHSCPDPHCRVRNDVRDRQGKNICCHFMKSVNKFSKGIFIQREIRECKVNFYSRSHII